MRQIPNITRRTFIKIAGWLGILTAIPLQVIRALGAERESKAVSQRGSVNQPAARSANNPSQSYPLGVNKNGYSTVYKAQGETPEDNMIALIDKMGGIETLIGQQDIVVVKPNAQWWAQGMTNTDALCAFMQSVLDRKGFRGEIIIAENHQYRQADSRGWTTQERNGRFNYNELIDHFHRMGYDNVTKYHWRGAGPNPEPIEGDDCCGQRVTGPLDGEGYVWREDIVYEAPNGRRCLMTYPVFKSRYSGITIDLKNGAWQNGHYLPHKPVKFINFAALNHHSAYCGVTGSVKHLMGVVDMTCGFHGAEPRGTYNVHFIGVERYIRFAGKIPGPLRHLRKVLAQRAYRNFHYTGGALGTFMAKIRMPDLHIITAHWVGWGSRTNRSLSGYPKALLASRDPVALDLVAAKDVLLAATPTDQKVYLNLNNPHVLNGPFHRFITTCHQQGVGNIDPKRIRVVDC